MLSDGEGGVYHQPPSSGSFLVPHLPLIEEAREKGIKHFLHEHPLIFKEDVRNGSKHPLYCDVCGMEIGRSGFSCCIEKCKGFNLHEFCASLPLEMKDYPQHPQHPLIFFTSRGFRCHVCKADYSFSLRTSFLHCFRCKVCDFHVDIRCAFMSFLVCPRTLHNHELTPRLYPASFLCSFCGEKHGEGETGISYQCKTCWFWIHEQCYSLPQSIEHDSHVHPLKLCYDLQGEKLPNYLCGLCKEEINSYLGFYVCKRCKYTLHTKCSTKKCRDPPIIEEEEEDQIIQFPLPSIEVVHNTLAQFIKNICQWKDEDEEDCNILSHPSHDHPLTLEFDLSKITSFSSTSRGEYKVICNGCILPLFINDAPFYSCNRSTCNFVLHKWCAKLPRELKHPDPAHTNTDTEHTLILQVKIKRFFGFFTCNGCREMGNGFAYKCNECENYYLDVRCAAFPRRVNHETHKHPLILKYGRTIGGCFSCGETNLDDEWLNRSTTPSSSLPSFTFGCDICHFSIHPRCLMLPQEIVHWYDEHGFKLTDPDVFIRDDNQGASEYHCEFCEESIVPDKLTYHCFECDQCADAKCVRKWFGLFPKHVKIGRLYDSELHKEHPLTCILPGEKFNCEHCNGRSILCKDLEIGFECTECQIRFGLKCIIDQHQLERKLKLKHDLFLRWNN
ncbi:uncharacterized protein LOC124936832 [Impatiens glandulifera]|uniref:uncharacterized protein LOC124936832 n=1 Tax=Impatiens glandulifera TaxID=253017 RepID=UPI001FB13077|nr:uncharacterized protein LOC124936832 [Impatiens glandulifera]